MFGHYYFFFLLSTAEQILLDYKQMYSSTPETLKVFIFYLFYDYFFCNLSKFIYYSFISYPLSHLCLFWLKLRKQTVLMPLVMVMSSLQPLGVTKAALMTSLDSHLSVFAEMDNQIEISTGRLKLCYQPHSPLSCPLTKEAISKSYQIYFKFLKNWNTLGLFSSCERKKRKMSSKDK